MTVDRNRLWILGAVVVMVAVVAGGWFLGIQPQLDAGSAANQTQQTVEAQNAQSAATLVALKKDYQGIGALKKQLAQLQQSVPSTAAMSDFVTELDQLGGAHGVSVTSISVSDALPYVPPAPAAGAAGSASAPSGSAAGSGSKSTPTPAPSPTATATPAPSAAPASGAASATGTVASAPGITATNFAAIPVQLALTGSYDKVLDFVHGLQNGPRLFLVTAISTSAASAASGAAAPPPGAVDAKVGGLVYVLLPAAAGTGGTPAGTPTPAPAG